MKAILRDRLSARFVNLIHESAQKRKKLIRKNK